MPAVFDGIFDRPESLHEEVLTTVKKGCYSGSETKNRGRVTVK